MPIADTHPETTAMIEQIAAAFDKVTANVGAGKSPVSTPLFRAVCKLDRATERLRHVVELQLSIELAHPAGAAPAPAEATS